jgi:antitoxin PrlF
LALCTLFEHKAGRIMAKIMANGRVTLPKDVRNAVGLKPGDEVEIRATASGGIYIEKPGTSQRYHERVDALVERRPIRNITTDELMEASTPAISAQVASSPHERTRYAGLSGKINRTGAPGFRFAHSGLRFSNRYLENFLYFSRCGMIESVPRRRILSAS